MNDKTKIVVFGVPVYLIMEQFSTGWLRWVKYAFACLVAAYGLLFVESLIWMLVQGTFDYSDSLFDQEAWLIPINMLVALPIMIRVLR